MVGTGPGTFAIPYQALKRPEAEMARLVHNDYLEQATDSGIPAFLLYSLFIASALIVTFRALKPTGWDFESRDFLAFAVWLGLAGGPPKSHGFRPVHSRPRLACFHLPRLVAGAGPSLTPTWPPAARQHLLCGQPHARSLLSAPRHENPVPQRA